MKETSKKSRKRMLAISSVALVAVLIVGGILAYLSNKTNTKENVFSFADNIRGEMDEPNWEAKEDLIPGMEVRKDPQITNTSIQEVDEYAAIQVTFKNGNGKDGTQTLTDEQLTRLFKLIEIDWNTTDWQLINGELDLTTPGAPTVKGPLVFAYKHKLGRGQITKPLFNTVKIKDPLAKDDFSWMTGNSPDHDKTCYSFDKACTCGTELTVRHHANCADPSDPISADCDCNPVTQHKSSCPSLDGTLKGTCEHMVANSLGGFTLIVDGAVVQAEEFTGINADLMTAFKTLFGISTP